MQFILQLQGIQPTEPADVDTPNAVRTNNPEPLSWATVSFVLH